MSHRTDPAAPRADYSDLTPELALSAVGEAFGIEPDGSFFAYPSYANRVYGLRADDGTEYVAKFYRPGRWTPEAILEEHAFVAELEAAEIPAVAPLATPDGDTLPVLAIEGMAGETEYPFALFPKRGGRLFDAERDEDWLRLGALAGRIHAVGQARPFSLRVGIGPGLAGRYADEIVDGGALDPDAVDRVAPLLRRSAALVDEALARAPAPIRLHGDFHRGNVLDRADGGLLAIDFDDASYGPAVQDLWLLLPGPASECRRELGLIVEGYEGFMPFDSRSLALVEPLRLLRMVHFIAWQARQRSDRGFAERWGDWGSKAYWMERALDLADQIERVESAGPGF
ncbi:MAG TPA: serine/threonine protein kinase [Spirochaetales bacterium]|nr:serine/threonine protein kinase [Spirochaetales bacterium]HPB64913.1 serine/threonine protein kinase [Spirochaetales bacterium]HPG85832.1 serine/threonine protein kinase [Spirochaetales bacterium]HPM73163.1 serine/threonine protein kinase [Spirochaetales bacterium]